MNRRKTFQRTLATFLLTIFTIFGTVVAHAEVKTYEGVGEYIMSDFETPDVAKQRAKQRAEQNACEKAGVFVESFTKTRKLQVVEDEIIAMTSGILKIIDVQSRRENADNDSTRFIVVVKAQIDDADVLKWLSKDSGEKSMLVAKMEELRRANEELERQLAELKKKVPAAKTEQDKEKITERFANEDKKFLSNQKVDEGWRLWEKKDFNGAKNLFNEAIQLNPDNSQAYSGRGTAYVDLRQYEQSIQDLTKAIQLNLNSDYVYNNRGAAYNGLKQYEQAISDFNKAINLNSKYALSYYNRGNAYLYQKQYEKAIQDYGKAIQFDSNYTEAYYNRGNANMYGLNRYEQAIQDFSKAIQLNQEYVEAYNNRGMAYYCLKQYEQALKDFNTALRLNLSSTDIRNNIEACIRAMGS